MNFDTHIHESPQSPVANLLEYLLHFILNESFETTLQASIPTLSPKYFSMLPLAMWTSSCTTTVIYSNLIITNLPGSTKFPVMSKISIRTFSLQIEDPIKLIHCVSQAILVFIKTVANQRFPQPLAVKKQNKKLNNSIKADDQKQGSGNSLTLLIVPFSPNVLPSSD